MERERAQKMGYFSPVWATIEETHACYSACLESVMAEAAEGRAEVLLGSHNEVRKGCFIDQIIPLKAKMTSVPRLNAGLDSPSRQFDG